MSKIVYGALFSFSRHAETRMAQRGIRTNSLDILLLHGTTYSAGEGCERYQLLDCTFRHLQTAGYDVQILRSAAKLCAIVNEHGVVVTCYHVSHDTRRCSGIKNRKRRGRSSQSAQKWI
ncbi:DUF4258 domain-containing protein [Paracoccus litorisediminis]|uniref:DUF4258 domain-containing protein n=1 Tax=Paracoccus litorisediminis TaxID=2006130 RepID=UPI003733D147